MGSEKKQSYIFSTLALVQKRKKRKKGQNKLTVNLARSRFAALLSFSRERQNFCHTAGSIGARRFILLSRKRERDSKRAILYPGNKTVHWLRLSKHKSWLARAPDFRLRTLSRACVCCFALLINRRCLSRRTFIPPILIAINWIDCLCFVICWESSAHTKTECKASLINCLYIFI